MHAKLKLAPALLALFALALPATAQANQTLSVEKTGNGSGKVTSSPAGISCDPTCSFSFADNTVVLLTGTPASGSAPVVWSGCETVTAEKKCKVTMSAAKTVKATFDLIKRQLKVERKGTGTGTVTSLPAGINCGQTCSAEYDNGTEVTLSATSGANTEAVKWAGCTSIVEGKCKVTMSMAKTVTATFALQRHQLSVSRGGGGTGEVTSSPTGIKCGTTCSASYDHGVLVTLTGTSGPNALPVKWSGCDSVNGENKCLVTMSAAKAVGAVFDIEGPTLSVSRFGSGTGTVTSSPSGIDCGGACAVNFIKGTTVTLTGTPGLHSEAVKWSGCDNVTEEGKCLVAMNAARSVTATFNLEPQYIQYSVSVQRKGTGQGTVTSVPGGIECGEDCSETYVNRTRLTLIATPAPGSVFDHWSGGSCAGTGPCEKTINSSRLVKAVFVAVGNRALTVSKAGSGSGTVSSNTGAIDCGGTCSAEIDASGKIVLSATPQVGSTFAGWSGACTGTGKCKLAMNEARAVTASFERQAPPAPQCVVPRLTGKTLARARAALSAAHCALGKVRKPRGAKLSQLRVRSSTPATGMVLAAGSKVALKLGRPKSRR